MSTERDGTRFRAVCRGEVDLTTHAALYDTVLTGVLHRGTRWIELDLEEVTFLSACGARSLLRLAGAAHEHGKPFELHTSAPVRRVLDMVVFLS